MAIPGLVDVLLLLARTSYWVSNASIKLISFLSLSLFLDLLSFLMYQATAKPISWSTKSVYSWFKMISKVANLIGFSVTFLFLNTSVVGLRLLSRRISAARLWWDDAFIVISLVGKLYVCD